MKEEDGSSVVCTVSAKNLHLLQQINLDEANEKCHQALNGKIRRVERIRRKDIIS